MPIFDLNTCVKSTWLCISEFPIEIILDPSVRPILSASDPFATVISSMPLEVTLEAIGVKEDCSMDLP